MRQMPPVSVLQPDAAKRCPRRTDICVALEVAQSVLPDKPENATRSAKDAGNGKCARLRTVKGENPRFSL